MRKTRYGLLLLLFMQVLSIAASTADRKIVQTECGLSSNEINVIYRNSQHLVWLGTGNGMDRCDGQRICPFSKRFATPLKGAVHSMTELPDNELLVGTSTGAFIYQPKENRMFPLDFGCRETSVRCVKKLSDGRILLATGKGLFSLDRKQLKTDIILCCSGSQPSLNDIAQINPDLIRFAGDDGVYEYKNTQDGHLLRKIYSSPAVHCLHVLHSSMYIGTTHGLLVNQGLDFHPTLVKGTSHLRVLSLASDSAGGLYIGTENSGMFTIPANTSAALPFHSEHPEVKTVKSLFCDETNTLWCGTQSSGLITYFLNGTYKGAVKDRNPFEPSIHLSEVIINAVSYDADTLPTVEKLDSNGYQVTIKGLNNRTLRMRISALNYRYPERNQYSYLLEGKDKNWSPASGNPIFAFPDLSPGTYTLWVKASNNDDVWTSVPTRIVVIVKPGFPEKTCLIAFILLTFFGSVILVLKRRKIFQKKR